MKELLRNLALILAIGMGVLGSHPVFASAVQTQPTVTLLVSLDPSFYPKGLAAVIHDYSKVPPHLEATFRKAFKNSGYDIQVIQNATIYDLYQVLHSPNEVGVFWVSHEAPISWSKDAGVSIDPLLVDSQLADVKSAFREIHPDIRWVSLVACDSDSIINWLKSEEQEDPIVTSNTVEMQGFNKEIDVNQGLSQAIRDARKALTAPPSGPSPCISDEGVAVRIERQLIAPASYTKGSMFPAVTIENNGQILGVFPEAKLQPGESSTQFQIIYVPVPGSSASAHDLELVLNSGIDPSSTPDDFVMGEFSAAANGPNATWKEFATPDGLPFGATERILLYQGATTANLQAQTYQPYACE